MSNIKLKILIVTTLLIIWSQCSFANASEINNNLEYSPKAIVFVSLGMPKALLISILKDADRYHVPVVIRGLVDNSFSKTMSIIFDLMKEMREIKGTETFSTDKNRAGILIDPLWFKYFSIKTVPAVVVTNQPLDSFSTSQNPSNNFDVIYGNIPLKRSLEILSVKGKEAKDVAASILGGHTDE